MNCRKCGAELHPEQKVCIQCGEVTAAGGKFDVEEERAWRPTPRQLQAAGGLAALLILIFVFYKALHVVPPDVVAKNWFEAMLSRSYAAADDHVTTSFQQDLSARMMDMRALAETWIEDITANNAKYTFSPPEFDNSASPRKARIMITIQSPDGQIVRQVLLDMIKIGRRWKIDRAL
ncbi:MAG: zinc ribbon domain-containing protein [Armatimonadota bacterium]|nr:zinc ribbon domain-containing protein [Armatimonadota bacterium]